MKLLCNALQLAVVIIESYLITPITSAPFLSLKNGKDIGTFYGGVTMKNSSRKGFDAHGKGLTGLTTCVMDITIADRRLEQICHVHKGHSTGAVTEQKEIAGQTTGTSHRKLQGMESYQYVFIERTLAGLVHPSIDMPEKGWTRRKNSMADCPEDT